MITQKTVPFCEAAGKTLLLVRPPQVGDDFNDLLKKGGVSAVEACLQQAQPAREALTQWLATPALENVPVPVKNINSPVLERE